MIEEILKLLSESGLEARGGSGEKKEKEFKGYTYIVLGEKKEYLDVSVSISDREDGGWGIFLTLTSNLFMEVKQEDVVVIKEKMEHVNDDEGFSEDGKPWAAMAFEPSKNFGKVVSMMVVGFDERDSPWREKFAEKASIFMELVRKHWPLPLTSLM